MDYTIKKRIVEDPKNKIEEEQIEPITKSDYVKKIIDSYFAERKSVIKGKELDDFIKYMEEHGFKVKRGYNSYGEEFFSFIEINKGFTVRTPRLGEGYSYLDIMDKIYDNSKTPKQKTIKQKSPRL